VPEPPEKCTVDSEPKSKEASPEAGTSTREDQGFSSSSTIEPHLITKVESHHLVRDLDFPKTEISYLDHGFSSGTFYKCMGVSFCRNRQSGIENYISMDGDLVYCKDVCGLMEELQLQHSPEQWRLFDHSSKVSLKRVLPRNGKKHSSVPVAHAAHMKEPTPTFKVC
jgi:hypothetical protein